MLRTPVLTQSSRRSSFTKRCRETVASNSDGDWDALLNAHGLTPSFGGAAAAVAQPADAAGASRRARDKRRRRQRMASTHAQVPSQTVVLACLLTQGLSPGDSGVHHGEIRPGWRRVTGAGFAALGRHSFVNGFGDCRWCHDEAERNTTIPTKKGSDVHDAR